MILCLFTAEYNSIVYTYYTFFLKFYYLLLWANVCHDVCGYQNNFVQAAGLRMGIWAGCVSWQLGGIKHG